MSTIVEFCAKSGMIETFGAMSSMEMDEMGVDEVEFNSVDSDYKYTISVARENI